MSKHTCGESRWLDTPTWWYEVSQLSECTVYQSNKSHDEEATAWEHRQDCVQALKGGHKKKICGTEGSQEHSGLHISKSEQVWNKQDSSWPD